MAKVSPTSLLTARPARYGTRVTGQDGGCSGHVPGCMVVWVHVQVVYMGAWAGGCMGRDSARARARPEPVPEPGHGQNPAKDRPKTAKDSQDGQ